MEGSGQPSISRVTPGSTARLLCPALASSSVCGGRGAPLAAAPQPWLPQAPLYLPSPSLTLQTEPPASVSGAVSNTLWAKQRSGGSVLTSPWPQGRPGPSTLGVITALWPRCPGSDSSLLPPHPGPLLPQAPHPRGKVPCPPVHPDACPLPVPWNTHSVWVKGGVGGWSAGRSHPGPFGQDARCPLSSGSGPQGPILTQGTLGWQAWGFPVAPV